MIALIMTLVLVFVSCDFLSSGDNEGGNTEHEHKMEGGSCVTCGRGYSEGLEFVSEGKGTCYVSGIGSCTDTDLIIPPTSPDGDKVTEIGNSAFTDCTSIVNVIIPDSVSYICFGAFMNCDSLTSVVIPDGVSTVGYSSFSGCDSLKSVVIGYGTTLIDYGAFENCGSLVSVTIPDSLTGIGAKAFSDCDSLTDVYYIGSEAEWGKILVLINNAPLKNATVHYDFVPEN